MSLTHILFQLFIGPLQLIYQIVFYYAKSFTGSIGFSLIILSLLVNFLLLPLYRRADAIQNEERQKEKKMDHWVKHIKKSFKGNERFMMLQTYYRQNDYKINMAAMLKLGEFMDYLRKSGVYDNTRIIIVSDHGTSEFRQFDDMILPESESEIKPEDNTLVENKLTDVTAFNPLLMVKDFNSKTTETDNCFMTNADIPTLTTEGLINDPVNPFSGKPITNEAKQGLQYVFYSDDWQFSSSAENLYSFGLWYSVHDDVRNVNNWKKLTGTVPDV